ncbi:COP9-signalosome 5B [Hibiscus syriacus]|uniref:COP9-signalosome 5B n=1 Tax=Hibiscus syriacus TaxID=106335 RepID=A0A6A2X881_HIBSY|nr:COP9-signalosome 5B [Hibiscus syriacus]
MASVSGADQRRPPRSGGKMLRPRRTMSRTTPYDRPRLFNSTQQNPNWISKHLFSPTRAVVSGATRVLSSVFGLESSSSSSSSDRDSTSDDTGGTNDGQDVSSQGLNNIEHGEPQPFAGKIETKRLIEQLLMQEEECDKLTNIIKSRVVDSPVTRGMWLERLNEMADRADVNNHDLCGTAVIEAKKWLEEKKSGSNSKSELHHGTSAQKFLTLAHSIEGEAGSPLDMAKTYMRTHPPWASPALNDIEFRSQRPFGVPLFKEETPYSIGGKYLSSSKVLLYAYSFVDWMSNVCLLILFYMTNVHGGLKRDSPATDSWNIQEEIRKVRSKATEEMLRTLSSPKIDWSSFALEQKSAPDSLAAKNLGPAEEITQIALKNQWRHLKFWLLYQIPEDALNSDALSIPATLGCEDYQGMEAVQSTERKRGETLDEGQKLQSTVDIKTASNSDVAADVDHFKETNGSILQFGSTTEGTVQNSQMEDNRVTLKEVAKTGCAAAAASTANGLPSGFSMSAEADKEPKKGPINEEDDTVGSRDENAGSADVKDKTKPLSEASLEVLVAVSNSQNNSSMQREGEGEDEGSLEQLNTPKSKRSMAGNSNAGMEKQQGKKVSRNTRRTRGRCGGNPLVCNYPLLSRWRLFSTGHWATWEFENNILTVETSDPLFDYDNTQAKLKLENVVGWYRSLNLVLAVVIDPTRTVSAGKVEIGAFGTYPQRYKPPDDPISD